MAVSTVVSFTKGYQAPKKNLTNLSGREMGNTNYKDCCLSCRMSFISSRYWKSSRDTAYLNTSLNLVESPRTEGFVQLEIASSNLIEDKWLWTFMATMTNCFNVHVVQAEKKKKIGAFRQRKKLIQKKTWDVGQSLKSTLLFATDWMSA